MSFILFLGYILNGLRAGFCLGDSYSEILLQI